MKTLFVQLSINDTDQHRGFTGVTKINEMLIVTTKNNTVMRYNMDHVVCYWETTDE